MRVMVFAYLDNNIGDDLMLMLLSRKFPQHEFYLYTSNSVVRENLSKYSNFVLRQPGQRRSDLGVIDVVLSIGGSIFNDLNSLRGKIARLRKIAFLVGARLQGKRIVTIGCNLGPYNDLAGLYLTAAELKLNSLVTVRDKASYALISRFSLNNCHLADDLVYGVDVPVRSSPRNGLGVSAFRSTHGGETNFENYRAIALLIDGYVRRTGKPVKLFAFDSECENDLSAAFHIMDLVEYKQNVKIVPYLGDVGSFIAEFDGCEVQLAIRFHAAVLSDVMGIGFVPIAYSNKMEALIADKFPGFKSMKISQLTHTSTVVPEIIDSVVNFSTICLGRGLKGNSQVHFEKLEAIFNES